MVKTMFCLSHTATQAAPLLEFVTPDSRVRVVMSLRSGLVLSLVVCGEVGPSTASLANPAPVYCGCPAGTHGCDLVSRVRLDQSANPVVVWLGLVSRVREVIMETWNMRKSQQPPKRKMRSTHLQKEEWKEGGTIQMRREGNVTQEEAGTAALPETES